jgi:hypothetical protein
MPANKSFEDSYTDYPFAPLVGAGIALSQVLTHKPRRQAGKPASAAPKGTMAAG